MGVPIRLLMVEDSTSAAALIVDLLSREGFDVHHQRVETLDEFRIALEMKSWDLITSDFTLPGFTAAEVLSLFHQSGLDIPLIVVSGTIGEETAATLMKNGASNYVLKKNVGRLPKVVHHELAETRERRERKAEEERKRRQELETINRELRKKNDQIMSDLRMARRIQERIIPRPEEIPSHSLFHFEASYTPMSEIGGDLYDVFQVGPGRYAFYIADVAGHGVPAALISMMVKVMFRSIEDWTPPPDWICSQINSALNLLLPEMGYFVTVFLGVLDLNERMLSYSNCGHPHPFLIEPAEKELQTLGTEGGLLGLFEEMKLETKKLPLRPGTKIFLFTDGIVEAQNSSGELYKTARLSALLWNHRHLPARDLIACMHQALRVYSEETIQLDDQTMVCLEIV